MEESTRAVAFLFRFYGCKLLYLMYLFASPDPVDLKDSVMLTNKIRHSVHWTD